MCTLILLRRPGHAWPVLIAANRDERLDRAWDPPAAHWPSQPGVVAGRDAIAGGTWLALNGSGLVAGVLNRPGSLGPAPGRRSRGELPLLAAEHPGAAVAAAALAALPAAEWRPFNLVLADARDAFFVHGLGGTGHPGVRPLPDGLSMVTAHDPNDLSSPRTRRHLPRFEAAAPPDPACGDWRSWEALLADDGFDPALGPAETLRVPPTDGFGTVCSSLIALGAAGERIWRFSDGPAGAAPFRPVPLPAT